MPVTKYISKGDWFDRGTEAIFICAADNGWALFSGIQDGKPDEEVCALDEFDIVEVV